MHEIEKKFLVLSKIFKEEALKKKDIKMGYLNTHPEKTVRLRIFGEEAVLTIKGKSTKKGLSRFEWEKKINKNEAEELLALCEPGIIEKIRYFVDIGDHTFEVDEFCGENEDLVLAEVELTSENEYFEKPDWLGEEVTGDIRYYNSHLAKNPYIHWKKDLL